MHDNALHDMVSRRQNGVSVKRWQCAPALQVRGDPFRLLHGRGADEHGAPPELRLVQQEVQPVQHLLLPACSKCNTSKTIIHVSSGLSHWRMTAERRKRYGMQQRLHLASLASLQPLACFHAHGFHAIHEHLMGKGL